MTFIGSLRALLNVIKFFLIELSHEWVDVKNIEFLNGILPHSGVAMETHFDQLRSYLENCKS